MSIGNVAIVPSRQSTDLSHDFASALILLLCILAVLLPMRLGERRLRG
ncbi:MAG: hypothetical protein KKG96_00745 [Proteobacteria bacterium]|nr:hypothetical protein [Pseudomonadota bacterium]